MTNDVKPLPLRWRLRWLVPTRGEWKTVLGDLHARFEGKCNVRTKDAIGAGGGYHHWRCQLPRGHRDEWHRYRNYVWRPGERTVFAPVPIGATGWLVNMTDRVGFGPSYRQRLQQRRAMFASASMKENI